MAILKNGKWQLTVIVTGYSTAFSTSSMDIKTINIEYENESLCRAAAKEFESKFSGSSVFTVRTVCTQTTLALTNGL